MVQEETAEATPSLGATLRKHREQKGSSLEEVAESTRISLPILKAIETDDFTSMPADAFCRGFYTIYANYLELDSEEIVGEYLTLRGVAPVPKDKQFSPPVRNSNKYNNYAQTPHVAPIFGKTTIAAIIVLAVIGICWYLNWNPVTYIGNTISTLQEDKQQEQIAQAPTSPPGQASSEKRDVKQEAVEASLYHLEIDFNSNGYLKEILEDGPVVDRQFTTGNTIAWEVKKKIVLELPEAVDAAIRLNGSPLPLPESIEGSRILSLPEDLNN